MRTLLFNRGAVAGFLSLFFGAAVGQPVTSDFSPQPLAEKTSDGYRVPQAEHRFEFPRDHGSHPDFKVEWWYLTGHLFGPSSERFGFQATFFRKAVPPRIPTESQSEVAFRTDEIFLFHAALLDVATGRFVHTERLARSGWDASASEKGLSVQVGEAQLRTPDPVLERFSLDAAVGEAAGFSLQLEPSKPLVVFGKDGVSRKGDSPTAASWYLTFPRMKAVGKVRVKERLIPVEGQVWMDHEISSSQLSGEQAGWDWAGIQFKDGREIMVYRLRQKDGKTDPASALTWVDASGKTKYYGASQFRWEAKGNWRSTRTVAVYPIPVLLSVPDPETGDVVEYTLEPLVLDQELDGAVSGVPYWEGACRVLSQGKEIGSAYVELTGYAGALGKALK